MQPEIEVRVRDVATVADVLDVPQFAIKCGAQLAEYICELAELAGIVGGLFVRYTRDEEQAALRELIDRGEKARRLAKLGVRNEEILGFGDRRCVPLYLVLIQVKSKQLRRRRVALQEICCIKRFVSVDPPDVNTAGSGN